MNIFQREQRSLFGEILDWMLTPLLLLWPVSLALTWLVLDGAIMLGYVLCGATLLARLQQGSAGRWFQRVTGGAFIAAGGVLAASHR